MDAKKKVLGFKTIGMFADILCLNIALFLSFLIRFKTVAGLQSLSQLQLFLFVNIIWFVLLFFVALYKENKPGYNISRLVYKLILGLFFHISVLSLIWFLTKEFSYSRLRLLYFYLIFFTLAALLRTIGVYILRKLRIRGYFSRNFVTIGNGGLLKSIINYFQDHPELGYRNLGNFDLNLPEEKKRLLHLFSIKRIHSVYCIMPSIDAFSADNLLSLATGNSKIKVVADFNTFIQKGLNIEYYDFLPILSVSNTLNIDRKSEFVKRTFDVGFSIFVMISGLPIFILLIFLTKVLSPGPVFYISDRIGKNGKTFKISKFRSMVTNADEIAEEFLDGDFHSRGEGDPRITNWGKFMRKTRLDELPQFWNVLKGEMSVVGPRPLPKYDIDMLINASEEKFRRIIMMKPGLTSLGQLRVGYAINQEENVKRMNMDLYYHRNYSFWNDFWLVLQTTRLMVDGKGK